MRGISDSMSEAAKLDRRVVMKAAAGMAALAASGVAVAKAVTPALAQEAGGTRADRWSPGDFQAASTSGWQTFQADYLFFSLGASWQGDVGTWPVIAVQLSEDGETWSETVGLVANTDDGGQPNRDDRLFTSLVFTDGAQWVRYQTLDSDGNPGSVTGLEFVYIDASDGPWDADIVPEADFSAAATNDDFAPPEVITRAQWGANEAYRFDQYGEVWPPEYETVTHIIIHHTATANRPVDVAGAIRSIYYFHCVEQGWGDIGYNYLVDHNGRIYQGRYGGQNVVGGHSYQYAVGSSGITTIGNFQSVDVSSQAKAALVAITAFVGRDLNPKGASNFHEAPNLPIISSHRDVLATTCPGDMLWADLPEIRNLVASTINAGTQETNNPAGIVVGDRIKVQTDDGKALNVRSAPGGTVVDSIGNKLPAMVVDGPVVRSDGNWYKISWYSLSRSGWAVAKYMIVYPFPPPASDEEDFAWALNLRFTTETNVRSKPSTSGSIRGTVPRNTWASVAAGPITAEGHDWYQVNIYNGTGGWVIKDNVTAAAVDENPSTAKFREGDTVTTTDTVNVRPRPGLAQKIISVESRGATFKITQPAYGTTGYNWYGVFNDKIGGGYVVENYLSKGTTPPAGKFKVGDTVRVTENLNLRSGPSTSNGIVRTLSAGTTGKVLSGPRTGSGYTWWQIQTNVGTGWAVQDWLAKSGGTTPPSNGKFAINDSIRVTENLNLRSGASTSSSVVTVLPAGTTGTVLAGPNTGSGYTWWQIRTSRGTGWAVQDWLAKTSSSLSSTPAPSGPAIGSTVTVFDGRLNLRSSASTSAGIVAVLPDGHQVTVIGGPETADGYTWYQVESSTHGTGWVVSLYIR